MKKLLILSLVVALIFLSGCIDITKTITEAQDEDVEFFFKIEGTKDGYETMETIVSVVIPAGATENTESFNFLLYDHAEGGWYVTITEIDIPTGWELKSNTNTEFISYGSEDPILTNSRFTNSPVLYPADIIAKVLSPWVRDREMTCYQVWINQDNNFEFVFWWEYKNNNWVKIYDMEGSEVFSIDMEKGNARFEADLPDGFYTVKTFHDGFETPIQEFLIGKP